MPLPKTLITPDPDLDASAPSIADFEAEAAAAAPLAAPSTAGKTPEQFAKEKRIEELKNEALLCYDCGPTDGGILVYAPEYAIATVALMFLFIVSDKRKRTERTGWRGWLRGRF